MKPPATQAKLSPRSFGDKIIQSLLAIDQTWQESLFDERLCNALDATPREHFVSSIFAQDCTEDISLPIGYGQTISKPSTVAKMLRAVHPEVHDSVLEIGAGCGYVAALLARLDTDVFAIEKLPQLVQDTRKRLDKLGLSKISLRCSDGRNGWRAVAPFDAIIVSVAFPQFPRPLLSQLSVRGKLVAPIVGGRGEQRLVLFQKIPSDNEGTTHFTETDLGPCEFVIAS